jgi:hypothetical protein
MEGNGFCQVKKARDQTPLGGYLNFHLYTLTAPRLKFYTIHAWLFDKDEKDLHHLAGSGLFLDARRSHVGYGREYFKKAFCSSAGFDSF